MNWKNCKIKKNMISLLTFALMIVSIIGVIPLEFVKACTSLYDGNLSYKFSCNSPIVSFYVEDLGLVYVCSKEKYTVDVVDDKGKVRNSYVCDDLSMCSHYGYYESFFPVDGQQGYSADYILTQEDLCNDPAFKNFGENVLTHVFACFLYDDDFAAEFKNKDYVTDNGAKGCHDNPEFDSSIGCPIVNHSSGNVMHDSDLEELYEILTWQRKTDTGFSLTENKYPVSKIEVYCEPDFRYYKDITHKKLDKKLDYKKGTKTLVASFDSKDLRGNVDMLGDVANKVNADFDSYMDSNNIKNRFVGYYYNFYVRVAVCDSLTVIPEKDKGWKYGGYTRFSVNCDVMDDGPTESEAYKEDEDGNLVKDEDSSANSDNNNGGSVNGKDLDDLNDQVDEKNSEKKDKSIEDATLTAKSLLEMVGNIPKIIAKIFSFLPAWCLDLIALSFVAIVVLIIYKLIRG